MTVYYTLPNGSKLRGFFWDDYYTGKEVFHNSMEVTEYDTEGNPIKVKDIRYRGEMSCKSHELKIHTDLDGVHYILWKGQRINLEEWDYHCIPILIEEIEYSKEIKDRWFISDDIILTSLMKFPKNWGVMIPPRYAHFIFPGTSIGITGDADEKHPIPFVPVEVEFRRIKDWHYKIHFKAQDPEIRKYTASEEYYFSDFCSLLKCGYLTMFEIEDENK